MSGEDWDEFAHGGKKQQSDASGGLNADDDFGEFEGFDADEVDTEMAQPLPQALQATWASFPDYVPSQHTTSSALQPDLLPTQASVNEPQSSINISHASVSSLDLPGLNSAGAGLGGGGGPPTLNNVGQPSQRLARHELPIMPSNLPDISPLEPNVIAGSFGITPDLQQDSNNNHQHVVLGVSLSQPDLAGLDLHRLSPSPLQSQFPDVNPHSSGGGYGIRDLPDLSPDIGEGSSRFGQLPSPNSRPDVSGPSSVHSPNLNSMLPDVSPSVRNRNQHFDLPDIRPTTVPSGFGHSPPDLADVQIQPQNFSQPQDFASASSASHVLSHSTTATSSLTADRVCQSSSPLNDEHHRTSFTRGLTNCHGGGSGDSLTQVHEQLNMLRHENERIMRELNEVKSRNVELVRLLSECLLAVRNWELQPQGGDQLQRVHQEIQVITKAVGELQACVPAQTEQLKSELSHQVQESLSKQSEQFTQYLEDHKQNPVEVLSALDQHEAQIVSKVQATIEQQSKDTNSQLQAFKQELLCDVKQLVQEVLAEGTSRHGDSDGVSEIERAVQDFKLYTEEQKKKDEKSRTVLVSLIDSVLVNTRQQLHDIFPSANSPNS